MAPIGSGRTGGRENGEERGDEAESINNLAGKPRDRITLKKSG